MGEFQGVYENQNHKQIWASNLDVVEKLSGNGQKGTPAWNHECFALATKEFVQCLQIVRKDLDVIVCIYLCL